MKHFVQNGLNPELGSQKTLVPGGESQWIICRNDPINLYDPNGENPVSDLLKGVAVNSAKTAVKVAKVYQIGQEAKQKGIEHKSWPYAHIYANARIKQEVGVEWAVAASLGKEVVDVAKCVFMGDSGSLYSAFQPQDFIMNEVGQLISDDKDPDDYTQEIIDQYEIEEGDPGPLNKYRWLLASQCLQVYLTQEAVIKQGNTSDQPADTD